MTLLVSIFGIATLIALFFFSRMLRCLRRHRYVRAGGSCMSCLFSAFIAGGAFIFAFSYYGYGRLVEEQLIAEIEFRRIGPDEYQARLMLPEQRDRFFNLRGNEWQIDARLVNWKPPATILGLDPIYRLERISGRFSEIDREQNEARTVHALSSPQSIDVWTVARQFPVLLPGVDAHYGSATYVPMLDGARFEVSLTRDTIIARPGNNIAEAAVGDWQQ